MFRRLMSPRTALLEASGTGGNVQQLGFTVRPARNLFELQEVAGLRHAAYGRHRPQHGQPAPDRYDFMPNAVVLVAIDKSSGRVVGSLRVVTGDVGPLELDAYVALPRGVTGVPAEAAYLGRGTAADRGPHGREREVVSVAVEPPAALPEDAAAAMAAEPKPEPPQNLVARQVFVKLGRRAEGLVEIKSGLSAGDVVITAGQNRLYNGVAVAIDNTITPDQKTAAQ